MRGMGGVGEREVEERCGKLMRVGGDVCGVRGTERPWSGVGLVRNAPATASVVTDGPLLVCFQW